MTFEYEIVGIATDEGTTMKDQPDDQDEKPCIVITAYSDELETEISVDNLPPVVGRLVRIGAKLTLTIEEVSPVSG